MKLKVKVAIVLTPDEAASMYSLANRAQSKGPDDEQMLASYREMLDRAAVVYDAHHSSFNAKVRKAVARAS